jgi:hypothetical protein
MILIIINLWCSLMMGACGLWILTERSMPRLVRICCALVAAGGTVNVIAMLLSVTGSGGYGAETIRPGEVFVNIGATVLMMRWTWRLRQHAVAPPAQS